MTVDVNTASCCPCQNIFFFLNYFVFAWLYYAVTRFTFVFLTQVRIYENGSCTASQWLRLRYDKKPEQFLLMYTRLCSFKGTHLLCLF